MTALCVVFDQILWILAQCLAKRDICLLILLSVEKYFWPNILSEPEILSKNKKKKKKKKKRIGPTGRSKYSCMCEMAPTLPKCGIVLPIACSCPFQHKIPLPTPPGIPSSSQVLLTVTALSLCCGIGIGIGNGIFNCNGFIYQSRSGRIDKT